MKWNPGIFLRHFMTVLIPFLIPVLVLAVVSMNYVEGKIQEDLRQKASSVLDQSKRTLTGVVNELSILAITLGSNQLIRDAVRTALEAERLTYDDFRALNFVRAILDVTVGAQPAIRSIRIYIRNDKNRVFGDDVGVTQICSVYDPTWFANLISVPIEDRGASLQSDPARQPAGGNGTFTVFSHLPHDDGYVLFEMKNEQVASILRNAITYNRQQVALVDENSKTILSVAQDDPGPKTASRLPSEDEILLKEPVAGLWSNMADFEIAFALTILKVDAHKDIVTIAYEKRPINSIAGFTYMPQMTVIDSIGLTDIDGLIIPGGNNDEHREELTQLIVNINKANRLLGAICRGPVFLARAGVLSGRYVTDCIVIESRIE